MAAPFYFPAATVTGAAGSKLLTFSADADIRFLKPDAKVYLGSRDSQIGPGFIVESVSPTGAAGGTAQVRGGGLPALPTFWGLASYAAVPFVIETSDPAADPLSYFNAQLASITSAYLALTGRRTTLDGNAREIWLDKQAAASAARLGFSQSGSTFFQLDQRRVTIAGIPNVEVFSLDWSPDGAAINSTFMIRRDNGAIIWGAGITNTYSGDVTIGKATPFLILNGSASGQVRGIKGQTNGSDRWQLELGSSDAEAGSEAGSNFALRSRTDTGTGLRNDLLINRATGAWTIGGLVLTVASAAASAGIRVPHGAAPTAPVNGDLWTTTAGVFWRINGATVQAAMTGAAVTFAGVNIGGALSGATTGAFSGAVSAAGVTSSSNVNIQGGSELNIYGPANSARFRIIHDNSLGYIQAGGGILFSGVAGAAANMSFEGQIRPNSDNAYSFGDGSHRVTQLFAMTTTISTSAEAEKDNFKPVRDDLLRAAMTTPIVEFQFKDAIERKGKKAARWHVGPTAEGFFRACQKYGVDPYGTAVYCEDAEIRPKIEKRKVEVQKTKTIKVEEERIEIRNGKAYRKTETVEHEEPVFDELDLYDGRKKIGTHRVPVMKEQTAEVVVEKETGRKVKGLRLTLFYALRQEALRRIQEGSLKV